MQVPGVLADYVTLDQGSGIVHTAPGHGAEDFHTGQKYDLEAYAPQDDEGGFTEGLPEYKGKDVFEANPIVVELLESAACSSASASFTHSYPHCWRCHNPGDFPRHRAMVHRMDARHDGRKSPPGSARRNPQGEMEARMGRRPHARNGGRASRLVHFAPALLGRAADRFLLRRLRQAARGLSRPCATCCRFSNAKAPTPGTRTLPKNFSRRGRSARCGAAKWRKENGHPRRLVRLRLHASRRAERKGRHLARRCVSRRPRPISRLVSQFAADWRSAFAAARLIDKCDARLDARRKRRADVEIARQRACIPTEICEKWGADLLRLWVASQDYHARTCACPTR